MIKTEFIIFKDFIFKLKSEPWYFLFNVKEIQQILIKIEMATNEIKMSFILFLTQLTPKNLFWPSQLPNQPIATYPLTGEVS